MKNSSEIKRLLTEEIQEAKSVIKTQEKIISNAENIIQQLYGNENQKLTATNNKKNVIKGKPGRKPALNPVETDKKTNNKKTANVPVATATLNTKAGVKQRVKRATTGTSTLSGSELFLSAMTHIKKDEVTIKDVVEEVSKMKNAAVQERVKDNTLTSYLTVSAENLARSGKLIKDKKKITGPGPKVFFKKAEETKASVSAE